MRENKLKVIAAALIAVLLIGAPMRAQVTIGLRAEPNGGALLDLKQRNPSANNTTATLGLGLSRVKLTHFNRLFPMLDPGYKDEENAKHIGLIVYNVNPAPVVWNTSDPVGLLVWDGSSWQPVKRMSAPKKRYWDYSFTGMAETFIVPETGNYLLEVWGGGAQSGRGGYSKGEIALTRGEVLYVYVGQASTGGNMPTAPWNGGALGGENFGPPAHLSGGAGAGSTDFRTIGGNWDEETSLYSRFLVAGGAGGNGGVNGTGAAGGFGGGTVGGNGSGSGSNQEGIGASQTAGGAGGTGSPSPCLPGNFGSGSTGGSTTGSYAGGGGGGGWYGGGGGDNGGGGGGGGGGSGWANTEIAYNNWVSANPTDANKYAHKGRYRLTNGSTVAGNATNSMPDWTKTDGSTMTGNAGNGHARITLLNP